MRFCLVIAIGSLLTSCAAPEKSYLDARSPAEALYQAVERAAEDPHLSFRLDIMPIFMRNGCNSGACHGAARGKDGFRMSLFGFDPAADY